MKESNGEGVKLRGRKLYSSVVHQILRKRLYTGDFDWDGSTYTGTHEPLVTRECWQRVQELLDARAENKTRKVKHDFAYTGLVHCGHCGCLFVGELKKRKYVYYHCTGNRGKCPEPYTRQEILAREFAASFRSWSFRSRSSNGSATLCSPPTRPSRRPARRPSRSCRPGYEQIQARIETMYMDKLDGRITQEFFDKHSATLALRTGRSAAQDPGYPEGHAGAHRSGHRHAASDEPGQRVVPAAARRGATPVAPGGC